MARLSVTLIDVGWGDSIFIEIEADSGERSFGLIDSNDKTRRDASGTFVRKYFERTNVSATAKPVFDFMILTHAHADHAQGLKALMQTFGVKKFWYSKASDWSAAALLLSYCVRSKNVIHHEAVNSGKIIDDIHGVKLKVLWPMYDVIDQNENNNSVVLAMSLGDVSFVLTGDAEAAVWEKIAGDIPADTKFIKVPHHGSKNGTIPNKSGLSWYSHCPADALLGISSHVKPFPHPSSETLKLIGSKGFTYYRTDQQYHLTFSTDGKTVSVRYSH